MTLLGTLLTLETTVDVIDVGCLIAIVFLLLHVGLQLATGKLVFKSSGSTTLDTDFSAAGCLLAAAGIVLKLISLGIST